MNPIASWDFPTTPIYQWPENQPPYLPAVQVASDLYPLIPMIAAKIANIAGALAPSTPVRMFCYNTLSASNWVNEAFTAAVKMVADLLSIQRTGQYTAQQIDNVVSDYLGCFSSALAVNNTQLYNSLQPNLRMAVGENYRTYNEMVAVCNQVNGTGRGHPARPSLHQPMQQTMQQPPRVPQGNRNANNSVQTNTFSNQPAPRVYSPKPDVTKTILTRPVQRAPQPVVTKQIETDIVQGEKEMDRSKHALVYSGVVFPTAPSEHKVNLERLEEAIAEIKDPTVAEIRNLEWGFDYSFDGAVYEAMSESMGIYADMNVVVPRLVGMVHPILSTVEIGKVFDKLGDQFTFADMARLLVVYVQETSKEDAALKRAHFAWLAQVDRVMTKLINNWLAGTFYNKTSIDSFLSDAGDLASFISTKYDRAGTAAFNRFQMAMLGTNMTRVVDLDFIRESGVEHYGTLTVPHCFFTTTETAAALNYDITSKMKRVVRESTSRLYQLLSKLSMISRARHAVRNIIVTADGCRYEFFESGLGEDVFHILEI